MTDVYEFAETDRHDLVYKFATLTDSEIVEKQENFEKFQAEKEAKKTAAAEAKAKTAHKEPEKNNKNSREKS